MIKREHDHSVNIHSDSYVNVLSQHNNIIMELSTLQAVTQGRNVCKWSSCIMGLPMDHLHHNQVRLNISFCDFSLNGL